jgi:hypothetical protein
MISAFGAAAQRYATGLGDLDAVVTDPEYIVEAYFEALQRRERGERFYGMILADDPRIALAYSVSPSILEQFPDIDLCSRAFAMLSNGTVQVGNRSAAEAWNDAPLQLVSSEFYRLAGAMLVRSYAEFSKFAERSGGFSRPVERVLVETALPTFERRIPDRPTIVIWAPHRTAPHTALHRFGLTEFLGETWCVAADTAGMAPDARVLAAGDPRVPELLARAVAVVCAEPNDPGDAVAFARRGFGVVAPLTSGAHEFAPEVIVWDAANATALLRAALKALGRPAAVRQTYVPPPPAPLAPPPPLPREQLPLVSVIMPTYNRPADLRNALRAVGAQTYPRVEAVVINDCGAPVADVVAEFPFARLFEHQINRGAVVAVETGMKHAAGDYLAFLPDDDSIYPDHIERVMFAMLRSGAKIAHGNGMLRYVERAGDGEWKTTGLNATLCSDTLTPTMALIATPVSENGVIQHRSVFDEAGSWSSESALADLELHMRLGVKFVFVHVDDVTFEFREHAGNLAKGLDFAPELLRIYTEVHPAPERPNLAPYRRETHAAMAARLPGEPAFPPTIRLG